MQAGDVGDAESPGEFQVREIDRSRRLARAWKIAAAPSYRDQTIGGAVGGGRRPVRIAAGGGIDATATGAGAVRRGGGDGSEISGGGGSAGGLAEMQAAHLMAPAGVGSSG